MNPKYIKAETIINKIQELEEERANPTTRNDLVEYNILDVIDSEIAVLKNILKPQ